MIFFFLLKGENILQVKRLIMATGKDAVAVWVENRWARYANEPLVQYLQRLDAKERAEVENEDGSMEDEEVIFCKIKLVRVLRNSYFYSYGIIILFHSCDESDTNIFCWQLRMARIT